MHVLEYVCVSLLIKNASHTMNTILYLISFLLWHFQLLLGNKGG